METAMIVKELEKKIDRLNIAFIIICSEIALLNGDRHGRLRYAKEILGAKIPVPDMNFVLTSNQDEKKESKNG